MKVKLSNKKTTTDNLLKMLSNKRNFILKCILFAVLLYLCVHLFANSNANLSRELQQVQAQAGRNLAALDAQHLLAAVQHNHEVEEQQQRKKDQQQQQQVDFELLQHVSSDIPPPVSTTIVTQPPPPAPPQLTINERVKEITQCVDKTMVSRTQQRGDYWVLYNYIRPKRRHKCEESITYTTHADYSFLDNLVPLLERWQGPISIAIHAPGTDFQNTLDSIAYLRDCVSPLVKEYVTFHVYFSTKHVPKQVPRHDKVLREAFNCSSSAPYINVTSDQMYKTQKKLLYPVNVGRNIARESAQTHFILPSDIELYPSPNLISKFLTMIAENRGPLLRANPRVFPLHLFEVGATQPVPETKTHLKEMLVNGTALPFHKKLCPGCHNVPKSKEWQMANETEGLHVFHIGKRMGYFIHWEPIFIGTHTDPLYDERLSWEGKSDKMTQGYALCVMDYDFMILDNAFLVHKPGVKVYKKDQKRAVLAAKTNQLIKKIIVPELKVLYGFKKGCAV